MFGLIVSREDRLLGWQASGAHLRREMAMRVERTMFAAGWGVSRLFFAAAVKR